MPSNNGQFDALSELRVIQNCPVSWNGMRGDDQVRYCSKCLKSVYNISNMDREAAVELIEKSEGKICVRYYRRPDGMIMTSDCPAKVKAKVKIFGILAPIAAVFGIPLFPLTATQGAVRLSPFKQVEFAAAEMERLNSEIKSSTNPDDRSDLVDARTRAHDRLIEGLKRVEEERKRGGEVK